MHQGILAIIFVPILLRVVPGVYVRGLAVQTVLPPKAGLAPQPRALAQLIITTYIAAPQLTISVMLATHNPTAPTAAVAAPRQQLPPVVPPARLVGQARFQILPPTPTTPLL
jgi:hypothetical protein